MQGPIGWAQCLPIRRIAQEQIRLGAWGTRVLIELHRFGHLRQRAVACLGQEDVGKENAQSAGVDFPFPHFPVAVPDLKFI